MHEKHLKSIRNLLIAERARRLKHHVEESDRPEDVEEVTLSSGNTIRALTWPAAVKAAIKELEYTTELIDSLLP